MRLLHSAHVFSERARYISAIDNLKDHDGFEPTRTALGSPPLGATRDMRACSTKDRLTSAGNGPKMYEDLLVLTMTRLRPSFLAVITSASGTAIFDARRYSPEIWMLEHDRFGWMAARAGLDNDRRSYIVMQRRESKHAIGDRELALVLLVRTNTIHCKIDGAQDAMGQRSKSESEISAAIKECVVEQYIPRRSSSSREPATAAPGGVGPRSAR